MDFELYIESPPKRICHKGTFRKNGDRKRLTNLEIQEVIRLYPDNFNWELERLFNVSPSAILNIRRKFDLKKSETINSVCRFAKGHKPHNKNKPHIFPPNSGQFPKNHIPQNHKEIGNIRLQEKSNSDERYYMIKIAEPKKWQLLHRYLWEKEFGKIPKGMILAFKDGNSLNYELSNLQLITRKENLERNRNYKKFSETMKNLWRKERWRELYGLKRETKLRIK